MARHPLISGVRRVLSVSGELMITLSVVLALLAVYEVWWTDVTAGRQAAHATARLLDDWQRASTPAPAAPDAPGYTGGQALGILHVPAMGRGYSVLVEEGTEDKVLNQAVAGHYSGTALPWDTAGNVALAAHRDGHGAKFHAIDRLRPGDPIVFETRESWYVYRVDRVLPSTSRNDTSAIAPVPPEAGYATPGRYITLTSCTPVYTSLYRIVVWGHLAQELPVDARRAPPAVLG